MAKRIPCACTRFRSAPRALFLGVVAALATLVLGTMERGRSLSSGAVFLPIETDADWIEARHSGASNCGQCHTFPEGTSHPVHVTVPLGALADLPLDGGKMTCLTCHDERTQQFHGRPGFGGGDPMLRRDPDTEGLCIACHTTDSSWVSPHAGGTRTAHATGAKGKGRRPHDAFAGLDSETQDCMACHDGLAAGDAGGGHSPVRMGFDRPTEHPLGVPLVTRNAGQQNEIRFVAKGALDPRIHLFDGRVGCGSCHNVYSKHDNLLVMSNTRSQLCLACHIE